MTREGIACPWAMFLPLRTAAFPEMDGWVDSRSCAGE